jgi:signal transduction histidine kinase
VIRRQWCSGTPAVRLCQVFANLLSNASKYSPEHAQIWLLKECAGEEACVTVRDEGIAIDPQMLPQVFELFLQGDRSLDRSQGGLGMGLTIVKHLVQMHGGRVVAHSDSLRKGSEFRVWLPARVPPQPGGHRSHSASPHRGKRGVFS